MKGLALSVCTFFFPLMLFATAEITQRSSAFGAQDLPSSTFIIRWAFRECAQHHFEPDGKALTLKEKLSPVQFDPSKVQPGDLVFARVPGLFFELMHPKINNPYILITHGDVDDAYKDEYTRYLNDKKLLAWFGIHPGVHYHPKFFTIPIGVIGLKAFYDKRDHMHAYFTKLRAVPKNNFLAMNFTDRTHAERKMVKCLFESQPFCSKFDETAPTMDYLAQMATCKFTLSPRGSAIDCYRTWEALLVGSIPVVRSSQLNVLYQNLPIVVVESWDQVTKEFLEQQYQEITSRQYSLEKLCFDYWYARIKAVQQSFLKKYRNTQNIQELYNQDDSEFVAQLVQVSTCWAEDKISFWGINGQDCKEKLQE